MGCTSAVPKVVRVRGSSEASSARKLALPLSSNTCNISREPDSQPRSLISFVANGDTERSNIGIGERQAHLSNIGREYRGNGSTLA